ncbi:hypothetical protein [Sporosarcina sp. HYO08]|uniref:hypothetical protein n=1 Tax=Sporosarcina sp. HYO08 TaxID=1759557 RepID=UPI00079931DE|nr:hypothetical protein [Sporosarcina sp. HYO08]KXH80745.1 hypothetical protein AU377_08355 [Sporosarcina sp. HYO08]
MDRSWMKWLWPILWMVGLVIILFAFSHFGQVVAEQTARTFNMAAKVWFETIVPFAAGLYLSLLCVKDWTFRPNWPTLLLITLPCLLITFYPPVVFSLSTTTIHFPLPLWLFEFGLSRILPIAAGLSLVMGLFWGSKR